MYKTIRLTEDEIFYLANIMNHFTDYVAGDDRPDHGFERLQRYREFPSDEKYKLYALAGKLKRKVISKSLSTFQKKSDIIADKSKSAKVDKNG